MADKTLKLTLLAEAAQALAALDEVRRRSESIGGAGGAPEVRLDVDTTGVDAATGALDELADAAQSLPEAEVKADATGVDAATGAVEDLADAAAAVPDADVDSDTGAIELSRQSLGELRSTADAVPKVMRFGTEVSQIRSAGELFGKLGGAIKSAAMKGGRFAAAQGMTALRTFGLSLLVTVAEVGRSLGRAALAGARWLAVQGLRALRSAVTGTIGAVKSLGASLGRAALSGGRWLAAKGVAALKVGLAAAAAALTAVSIAVVKFGAEQEQTRLKFEVMLGSVKKANKMLAELQHFANVTPFDTAGVVKAGQTLIAFGVPATQTMDHLRMIGDVSAGTGKDLTELAAIYGKVMAKGKADTEVLNQMVEAGIPIIGALAKMYGVSAEEVYKMAEQGKIAAADITKAFAQMTGAGGPFADMMKRQSQTVGGLWSTLLGNLSTAAAILGEQLAPIMQTVLGYFVEWSDKIVAMATDGRLLQMLGNVARVGVTAFVEIAKAGNTMWNFLIAGLQTFKAWGDTIWAAIKTGFYGLVGGIAKGFLEMINGILSAYNWVITKFGGEGVQLLDTSGADEMLDKAKEAAKETGEAFTRATDGGYFGEAINKNEEFNKQADAVAEKIDGAVSDWLDKSQKEIDKRNEKTDDDKEEAAAPAAEAKKSAPGKPERERKADTDSLSKIGLYNWGANAVKSLDQERNKLLKTIADKIGRPVTVQENTV